MSSNTMNSAIFDSKLIQPRVLQTLADDAQVELSTELATRFPKKRVDKKINLVILHVDINGSASMSLTLPEIRISLFCLVSCISQDLKFGSLNIGSCLRVTFAFFRRCFVLFLAIQQEVYS
jgi:hypothetical protein